MAIEINPYLYSAGNVALDSSPSLELAARLEAKKAAKDEALNQYFNDLTGKINTAGVRVQDLDSQTGGINKDIQDWQNEWMLKKNDIKRGGIAQQEYMQKYQNILRRIEQSKQRAKTELEIGKAKLEGKFDPDDDDINILSQIGKSIYDPSSYKKDGVSEYGISDLSPAIPEFDADKQVKFWNSATKGMTAGKIYDYANKKTDKTTGQAIVPYKKTYSQEQIKSIALNAADAAVTDKSARKYYNRILDNPESAEWKRLNEAYRSVFGANELVSSPEQAAAADAILRASTPLEVGEEQELNRQQAQEYKIYNMMANRGGGSRSEGIGNYDVFGQYANKIKKIEPTSIGKLAGVRGRNIILAEDISDSHKKLFGNVQPKFDKNIGAYYEIIDDDTWVGNGNQKIYRLDIAKNNQGTLTKSEVDRGALDLRIDNVDYLPKYLDGIGSPKPQPKPQPKPPTPQSDWKKRAKKVK